MHLPLSGGQLSDLLLALVRERPFLATVVFLFGAFSAIRLVHHTATVLLETFIIQGKSLKKFGAKKGAWAVVTGASDGIGKEFASQLAQAGFNVLLIARNKVLLESVASHIVKKYPGVLTKVQTIDFASADDASYDQLSRVLQGLDVGVLVNNVGKSHAMPVYLQDTPTDEMRDIVTININATLRVTYATLPGMIQRKRGLILNIGSFAGSVPSPMLATYSGTKAFLSTFSGALAEEVRQYNIVVEHVNTYFVVSKLSKIRKSSLLIPTPIQFVRAVLSKIGLACGAGFSGRPGTSTPYWSHALLDYAITLIGIPSLFIRYTHGLHIGIRKRALRKQERESKRVD